MPDTFKTRHLVSQKVIKWTKEGAIQIILVEGYSMKYHFDILPTKGPVKLIKRVKIAHSFLQSVSDQFHIIILSLLM